MRALVLFGSKSDAPVSDLIVTQLGNAGFSEVRQEYISAHRRPDLLEKVLEEKTHDFVVTGAGLAAHLPGVTASKTFKAVVGVPVNSAFEGFDALVNMIQMPPGIPVLTLSPAMVKGASSLWKAAVTMAKGPTGPVHFVADKKTILGDLTKKARLILDTAAVTWSASSKPEKGQLNIVACPNGVLPRGVRLPADALSIFVPVYAPARLQKRETFFSFVKNVGGSKAKGLWVGTNNFVNAVCAALEIFNNSGQYDDLLSRVKKGEF